MEHPLGQRVRAAVPILQCPETRQSLQIRADGGLVRADDDAEVLSVDGQPVLVDFDNSILDRETVLATRGTSLIGPRRTSRPWWKRLILGENKTAPETGRRLVELLADLGPEPIVLIIGGGTVSDGSDVLYQADGLRILSFDVYASPHTDFVADAHAIPLRDQSIDAVWIEAVLEHVLSPHVVADEIWRVLKPGGLVYAATPFLQPVHEKAYDFTRFTESGHRWLFRRFECLESGVTTGPGSVLFQILRYGLGAVFHNRKLGAILSVPFFWLRFMDAFAPRSHASDCASGVFFLGRRSEHPIRPSDMPAFFKGVW